MTTITGIAFSDKSLELKGRQNGELQKNNSIKAEHWPTYLIEQNDKHHHGVATLECGKTNLWLCF
jgi:hypothetical protein